MKKQHRRKKKKSPSPAELDILLHDPAYRHRRMLSLQSREENLQPAEWWEWGKLLVFEGCVNEDNHKLDDGVDCLMRAAEGEHPFPEAVLDLSWVLTFRGMHSMALPYAKRATELMPDRRDAWVFYGRSLLERNRPTEALNAMEHACAQEDATPEDHQLLKELKAGTAKKTAYIHSFFTLPQGLEIEKQIPEEEAIRYQLFIHKQFLAIHPDNEELLYPNSLLRYWLKQYDQNIPLLLKLLHINPHHEKGLCLLALSYEKQGEVEKAMAYYQKTIEENPSSVMALQNLAKHYLDAGQAFEARDLLEQVQAIDPHDAVGLHLYGNSIALIEKDYAREAEYHRKALKQAPGRGDFLVSYAMCLLQDGDFKTLDPLWKKHKAQIFQFKPARDFYELLAICIDTANDFDELYNMVNRYYKTDLGGKPFERVLRKMKQLISREFTLDMRYDAYNEVGVLAGECDLQELSLELFSAAEPLANGDRSATYNRAVALGQLQKYEEALALLEEVNASRELCIRANIFNDSGQTNRAIEDYLQAHRLDKDFLLPVSQGLLLALDFEDWSSAEQFYNHLAEVKENPLDVGLLRAKYETARGEDWKAVSSLKEAIAQHTTLYQEKLETHGQLLNKIQNRSPKDDDSQLIEEASQFFEGSDASYFQRSQSHQLPQAWYLLALSYFKCNQIQETLNTIYQFAEENTIDDNNWYVLQAECLSIQGEHPQAQELLETLKDEPPPVVGRALQALKQAEIEQANSLALYAQELEKENDSFNHALGNTRAMAGAIRAFVSLSQNDAEQALVHVEQAYAKDKQSSFVALAYIKSLIAHDQGEAALNVAASTLGHRPGDPELLRWMVEYYLEADQIEPAEQVLQTHREFLLLRHEKALAFQLGETIAHQKLLQLENNSSIPELKHFPWMDDLQPTARHWLQTAIQYADYMEYLRLGLASYLCKVAETECVHRLILPFQAEVKNESFEVDMRLRDLSQYLVGYQKHPPSLGGLLIALEAAARPAHAKDSNVLKKWREFILSARHSARSGVLLSTSFLERLSFLKDARNRVAHLGDLSSEEFNKLYKFMLDADQPGHFFQALGIFRK